MNVDEFLDSVELGDKEPDTIVIESADEALTPSLLGGECQIQMELPVDATSPTVDPVPAASISPKPISDSSPVPSPVASISSKAIPSPVHTPHLKTPVSEQTAEAVKRESHESKTVFDLVEEINKSIKGKNLSLALTQYSHLEKEQTKVPLSDELLKLELNKLMLHLSKHISSLKSEKESDFNRSVHLMKKDLSGGKKSLSDGNFQAAKTVLVRLLSNYRDLPAGFSQRSDSLRDHISRYQLDLKKVQQKLIKKKLLGIKSGVIKLIKKSDILVQENDLLTAKDCLKDAKTLYETVEKHYRLQLEDVYNDLLKKMSSIDMVLQIKSLRKELGEDFKTAFEADYPKGNVKLVKNRNSSSNVKPRKTSSAPLGRVNVFNPGRSSASNFTSDKSTRKVRESKSEENVNLIDFSLRRAKLNKAKISFLDKDYALTQKLLLDLDKEFPGDFEITEFISAMEADDGFLDSDISKKDLKMVEAAESNLEKAETDLDKGDVASAKKDLGDAISEKGDSIEIEEVSEEIEADAKAIDKSNSFDDLKQKLEHAKTDLDIKLISRRLTLAKHQIKKKDFVKAKTNLDIVLKKDPKNRSAKKLLNLIH